METIQPILAALLDLAPAWCRVRADLDADRTRSQKELSRYLWDASVDLAASLDPEHIVVGCQFWTWEVSPERVDLFLRLTYRGGVEARLFRDLRHFRLETFLDLARGVDPFDAAARAALIKSYLGSIHPRGATRAPTGHGRKSPAPPGAGVSKFLDGKPWADCPEGADRGPLCGGIPVELCPELLEPRPDILSPSILSQCLRYWEKNEIPAQIGSPRIPGQRMPQQEIGRALFPVEPLPDGAKLIYSDDPEEGES